jgi:deazaflavin-dependent oxidoreductase (nitroreductase family)
MAYLKPNAFTRKVFNPIAMRLGTGGSETLVVPRRRTGAPQRIPVIPVEHEGSRYIVSTRGESDWVRNLREAGGGEIESKAGLEAFRAAEIPLEQRDAIIAAYREKAGKTVETYWKQLPDPKDHPVFRVEPAGG